MASGSSRGYHFIDEYRTCPRRFFLHRIAGYESSEGKSSFVLGTALHNAQERLLKNETLEQTIEKLIDELTEARSTWFEQEDFEADVHQAEYAIVTWYDTFFAADQAEYELVGCELELEAALPDGTIVTGRLDRLYRKGNQYTIMDTKTTKWGAESVFKSMDFGDQATCYTWLVLEMFGHELIVEVLPDVLMLKGKPKAVRPASIIRSDSEIALFLESMMGTWAELRTKLRAYESSQLPAAFLFPRAPTACQLFGCDYCDICRKFVDETTGELTGFKRVECLSSSMLAKGTK